MENTPEFWNNITSHITARYKHNEVWSLLSRLVLGALVYFIWQERNARIFSKRTRSPQQLKEEIIQEIRLKLMSLNWKSSMEVLSMKNIWNIA